MLIVFRLSLISSPRNFGRATERVLLVHVNLIDLSFFGKKITGANEMKYSISNEPIRWEATGPTMKTSRSQPFNQLPDVGHCEGGFVLYSTY